MFGAPISDRGDHAVRREIDYAEELGIRATRLHAICQRMLSHPPLELVHDRLMQEAKLRLERSAAACRRFLASSASEIPPVSPVFFKRHAGLSPARYRALCVSEAPKLTIPTSFDYHDWP